MLNCEMWVAETVYGALIKMVLPTIIYSCELLNSCGLLLISCDQYTELFNISI